MGQVRHGSATTTHAIRAAIQRSQASLAQLSQELGINPKTVAKWRKRATVEDLNTGPKEPRSTVLTEAEEAMIVAFRRHMLQLRTQAQDPQRSHTLRIHLQNLDFRAKSIHLKSDPPIAGTEHLSGCHHGLAHPNGSGLAHLEHRAMVRHRSGDHGEGGRFLRRGAERGGLLLRHVRDHEHRSGQPIHLFRLDRPPAPHRGRQRGRRRHGPGRGSPRWQPRAARSR